MVAGRLIGRLSMLRWQHVGGQPYHYLLTSFQPSALPSLQTKAEIEACREQRLPSPWRDRPVEESLRVFEEMRRGLIDEGKVRAPCPHSLLCMRASRGSLGGVCWRLDGCACVFDHKAQVPCGGLDGS